MKAVALFALLAPLGANAHYIFNRLIVNGASIGGEYAYTRKNTNSYKPSFPQEMMNSPDLRCNKGAKAGGTAVSVSIRIVYATYTDFVLDLQRQGW